MGDDKDPNLNSSIREDFRKRSVIADHEGTCKLCNLPIKIGHRLIKMEEYTIASFIDPTHVDYVHLDCAEILVLGAEVASEDFNSSAPADPFENAIQVDEPEN